MEQLIEDFLSNLWAVFLDETSIDLESSGNKDTQECMPQKDASFDLVLTFRQVQRRRSEAGRWQP